MTSWGRAEQCRYVLILMDLNLKVDSLRFTERFEDKLHILYFYILFLGVISIVNVDII